MLQAIAMIAGFAILLWSLGLPSIRFADAANLTQVSDTLSDSSPAASSTHTVVFTTPTGVGNSETIQITFPAGFTGSSTIVAADVTFLDGVTSQTVVDGVPAAGQWGLTWSNNTFILTAAADESIAAGGTSTITVGNASGNRLSNPATPTNGNQSYEIDITAGASDSGSTRVVILDSVTVTAAVDTIFTFSVNGLPAGSSMNGDTSTGASGSTTIPFGELTANNATTVAQQLAVSTNAANGFTVTVQTDGQLESSTGADIDAFDDGVVSTLPATWSAPAGTVGSENTYGHWGVTSDDPSANRASEFGSQEYVGVDTTPVNVMSHTGPVNGTNEGGIGQGTTTVGYQIEISALQEAGDDYTAQLIYVATPTF